MGIHRRITWLAALAVILSALAGLVSAPPAAAQDGSHVVIYSAQTVVPPDKKSLTLDMVFGVLDATDNPLSDALNTNADITFGEGGGNTTGALSRPQSQINVVLVVDLSSSVARVQTGLKQSISDMVRAADPLVQFSLLGFADKVVLDMGFTGNHDDTINNGLSKLRASNSAATCLYDTLFAALDRLRKEDVTKRRAIVAFTDSKDEPYPQANGAQCSKHSLDEVIKYAADPGDPNTRVPIHIIGLQTPGLDQPSLQRIAKGTNGVLKIGPDTQLPQLFNSALAILKNQYHVVVPVAAPTGQRTVTLSVSINGRAIQPGLTTFVIKDADLPASTPTPTLSPTPAPSVEIQGVGLNKSDASQLLVTAKTSGEALINSFTVTITDFDTHLKIEEFPIQPPLPNPITLKAQGLKADGSYLLEITAYDKNGTIVAQSQPPFTFRYQLPPTGTPAPTATPTPPPTVTDTLRQNAGVLLPVVGVAVVALIVVLLFVLRSNRPKPEPSWNSSLTGMVQRGGAGTFLPPEQTMPPPQQQQFGQYGGFNQPSQVQSPAQPAMDPRMTNPVPLMLRPAAALTVTQTRDKSLILGQRIEIMDVPFRIGREGPDIKLPGDDRVSRRHAIIDYGPAGYFVEDQGSMHGTFVNRERIIGRADLLDGIEVGIGPGTIFTFSVASSPNDMDRTNAIPLDNR